MQNLNCCDKSVLVDCWKCLQNIFLEYETSGQVSMQFRKDIASLIDSMINVLETMNSHLTNAPMIFNEKDYYETIQCILDIVVLLEDKSSSFQFFPSPFMFRLCCLVVYVVLNLLERQSRSKENLAMSYVSLLHRCIDLFPKLLNRITEDLKFKCHEILEESSLFHKTSDVETQNSLKILLLISHTPSIHDFMFLLWDYISTIKNVCDRVIEMLNDCTVMICMKEKCHILYSFVLCLPTFRLCHLTSYKPLEFLWHSSFFIPFYQNTTHCFVSYCDTTLQYLFCKITTRILQQECLIQQDLSCCIDLLYTLLEQIVYLKISLTITTGDVFNFYQHTSKHSAQLMANKATRVCSLLLPLVTTSFEEWKEQKQLFTLLCRLLKEHIAPRSLCVPCLFTQFKQWTFPLTKMDLFCTTLQDLFVTHVSFLTPSIHGPILVQLLFHAWSSLCYQTKQSLSYSLAKQFFHWFLHFSIDFSQGVMKKKTQLFFVLYVWRLLGRKLEKHTLLFNTCLKYLLSYALFTTSLHNVTMAETHSDWETVRANIVCYPSRSQTNLMQYVLFSYLNQRNQFNIVFNVFQNVFKRIHLLLQSLFYHTPLENIIKFHLQNSFDDVWNQCFSLHHLIAFLHIPLRLLKQYGTVSHITQAKETLELFFQYFIPLQPALFSTHYFNNFHQKSITGHWNLTLVHYDLFCNCLDTFVCYPHIITKKTFTCILNYTNDMLLPRNLTMLTRTLVPWIPRLLVSLWSLNNLITCLPHIHSKYPPLVVRCINKSICLLKTLVECHQDASCSQCTTIISYIVTWFVVLTYQSTHSSNNTCFTWCDKNQLFLLGKALNEFKKDTTIQSIVTLFCDCFENKRWEPSLNKQINTLLLEYLQEPETMKKLP